MKNPYKKNPDAALGQDIRQKLETPARSPCYTSAHGSPDTPWDALDAYALRVQTQLEARDLKTAQLILETLSAVFFERWYVESVEISDYGEEAGEFVKELSALWAEQIKATSPSQTQKQKWRACFQSWQTQLDDYGQADCWHSALAALGD